MARKRIWAVGCTIALSAMGVLAVSPQTGSAAPGESDVPIGNPDLPLGCGIDILTILDESGSIASAGATTDVQDAFKAFTRALQNTGSAMAVTEFSSVARLPLAGAMAREYVTVTTDSIADVFDPYINTFNPSGRTHWEDAFRVGRYFLPRPTAARPHLVVFITDGDPNQGVNDSVVTYDPGNPDVDENEYELKVPLSDSEQTSPGTETAKDRAVSNANTLKNQGSHVLSVAVGSGVSSQDSLDRIIAVSGPDVYSGVGEFDIQTDDVYRVLNFEDLEEALRDAAFQLCAPSINVQKLVDLTPDPGPDDFVPGVGWDITAQADPEPSLWVLPEGATGDTATAATGADGFVTFQWETAGSADSDVVITEEDPAGVGAGFVNDQSLSQCAYRTPDTNGDVPLDVTTTDGGLSTTVPDDAIVTCQLVNRALPAPAISLVKSTNGVDANTPADAPSIPLGDPVNWTYLVTNTGNVTVSGLTVTDDQGVTVTCPVTELAPAATTTCTGTGTATVGLYSNLGTATASDVEGTEVSDTDPSHYIGTGPAVDITKLANGEDANEAPGALVREGDDVTMTFVVTNPGTEPVHDVVVTDDKGLVPVFVGGDTDGDDELDPGETWTYTADAGQATVGTDYTNTGTVTGLGPQDEEVTDSDPATVTVDTQTGGLGTTTTTAPGNGEPPEGGDSSTGETLPVTGTSLGIVLACGALALGAGLFFRRRATGRPLA